MWCAEKVETGGGKIAEGTDATAVISCADGVTTIFHEPKIVFLYERCNGGEIEWITQRVCQHHGSGPVRARGFQLADIDVVSRESDVDKNGHQIVLDDGIDRGGEAGRERDHFIAGLQSAVTEFERSQRRERRPGAGGRGRN